MIQVVFKTKMNSIINKILIRTAERKISFKFPIIMFLYLVTKAYQKTTNQNYTKMTKMKNMLIN